MEDTENKAGEDSGSNPTGARKKAQSKPRGGPRGRQFKGTFNKQDGALLRKAKKYDRMDKIKPGVCSAPHRKGIHN